MYLILIIWVKERMNSLNNGLELNNFNTVEIEKIINRDYSKGLSKELSGVIYSLGRDIQNNMEYDYAFNNLVYLSKSSIKEIRLLAILGFSLMSMNKLDRDIVEPIITNEWINADTKEKEQLKVAIDDINLFLNWNLKLK